MTKERCREEETISLKAKECAMREVEEQLESSYPNLMGDEEEEEEGMDDLATGQCGSGGILELRESEPGKIKQITLKNFMCHRRLTVSSKKSFSFISMLLHLLVTDCPFHDDNVIIHVAVAGIFFHPRFPLCLYL